MSARRILVVASGYPSVDDPTAGRFVADLVSATQQHGVAESLVVSCEAVPTWGTARLRAAQAAAIGELFTAGVAADPAAAFRAGSPVAGAPGPIARPAVPAPTASTAPAAAVAARAAALEAVWPAALALAAGSQPGSAGSGASVIDLVHAHIGLPDGAAAAVLAARHDVPLVVTEHSSLVPAIAADPARHAAYRAGLVRAAVIVCVSEVLAADVRSAVPEVADRIRVVPNAVAVDDFRPAPRHERRANELLFVGYRKPTKGISLLLEAFALARGERPGITLRLVGPPGPSAAEREWQALAAQLGIAEAVAFEGRASRGEVAEAMARATLFVHASQRETFGVVAAEALAAGLPVVATDSGGVSEVLGPDPERVGAIVPPGSAPLLAAAMITTLDRAASFDPDELHRFARERYGAAAVAARMAEVYDAALATSASTGGDAATTTRRAPSPARTAHDRRLVVGGDADRVARILGGETAPGPKTLIVTGRPLAPAVPGADVRTVPGWADRLEARRAAQGALGAGGMRLRGGAARIVRRPVAAVRELLWRLPRREADLLARARSVVAAAADVAAADAGASSPTVVALDGFDALVVLPLVRAGRVTPVPGAGRWLADAVASPPADGGLAAGASTSDAGGGDPAPPDAPAA